MTEHPITTWHRMIHDRSPVGLAAALHLFVNPTFHYVREIMGATDAMLEFETEIDGIVVNGVDIIKWNEAGKITEFKVMLRPLKAVNLIHQMMGAMLQAR